MSKHDLNALLGSRICHDLISPLGAIGNGVELLNMSSPATMPEVALISESVENANARIRFFRIAFGVANPDQRLGNSEVGLVLRDVYKTSRIKVDWQVERDGRREEVKLVFLLLLCFETALPWGGRVTVRHDDGIWNVAGTAERLSLNDRMWQLLDNPDAAVELTSANVHFALAPETAQKIGRKLRTETGEKSIGVSF
ncbi:histidine phosphotransferase family protein [Roseitranquillus sediminis]|uniref:histidine phosphotransferase family protein n=1 Tax=Roseitranquillus sediminis TaxID=2809051 RepID=UPI001D0C8871|nr:histidine phosphotransferase family protein [Roseitranquillus sediminis]MBM9595516.1 histidine phosphotransferase [Roseitranquillus sediminis]